MVWLKREKYATQMAEETVSEGSSHMLIRETLIFYLGTSSLGRNRGL